jgi:hypothetical protein
MAHAGDGFSSPEVAVHGATICETPSTRITMRTYVFAFFGLALLLSACRIESNVILDIDEDGSATVGAEVGLDEEMLNFVSQDGIDPAELFNQLPELGDEAVEPINRVEGDMTFFGFTTTVDDLSAYDFAGLQGETFSEFLYEFDDDSATISATVDATGFGDLGGGDFPIPPTDITADIFSAQVLVNMPGTVTEHNADAVTGDGTLVWDLPLTGSVDIFAASTFGNSAPVWFWFVIAGILIVGGAAAVATVVTSRKNSENAVAAAAAASQEDSTQTEDGSQPSAVSNRPHDSSQQPEGSIHEDDGDPAKS